MEYPNHRKYLAQTQQSLLDSRIERQLSQFSIFPNSQIESKSPNPKSTIPKSNHTAQASHQSQTQCPNHKSAVFKMNYSRKESHRFPSKSTFKMNHTTQESHQSPSKNTRSTKRRAKLEEKGKGKAPLEQQELKSKERGKGKAPLDQEEPKLKGKKRKVEINEGLNEKDLIDAKEKKQVRPSTTRNSNPHSKTDHGQSSKTPNPKSPNHKTQNPKPKTLKAFCKICMERTPLAQTFTINQCNHIFCNTCTISYISSKIQENNSVISCPDPDCKLGFMDPVLCSEILPKDLFEKWGLLLCESFVGNDKKFYCPFKDCSALLLHEGDEITNSECPHCNRMFCAKCEVPWHGDMSCDEFQNLRKNEKIEGKEDLMLRELANNKKWQRCPNCKMYVEKISGCMFMKCRCGYGFCYVCATEMSQVTHYCTKCMR